MSQNYIKDVLNENWDDYQLRSIANGGNSTFFEILKEYEIVDLEFSKRYKHEATLWHKRRNMWLMESANLGKIYPEAKPAKNFDERIERAKSFTKDFGTKKVETMERSIEEMKVTAIGLKASAEQNPEFSQMQKNINSIHKHEKVVQTKAKAAEIGSKVATWGMGLKSKWNAKRNSKKGPRPDGTADDAPVQVESREEIQEKAKAQTLARLQNEIEKAMGTQSETLTFGPADKEEGGDLSVWKAELKGKAGTPYEGGTWGITLDFNQTSCQNSEPSYPFTSPMIWFNTKIYHPNVNSDGQISHTNFQISGWSPSYTVSQQLAMIEDMLYDPMSQSGTASESEILELLKTDKAKYDENCKEWTN